MIFVPIQSEIPFAVEADVFVNHDGRPGLDCRWAVAFKRVGSAARSDGAPNALLSAWEDRAGQLTRAILTRTSGACCFIGNRRVIADTPAIDGARIFGAIVPVVAVLRGFTRNSAFARNADTGGTHQAERASATILDWHALAHALGAGVLGALIPVVAVVLALAFGHAARTAASSRTATTSRATATIGASDHRHGAQR
jgi:hypothetical protein